MNDYVRGLPRGGGQRYYRSRRRDQQRPAGRQQRHQRHRHHGQHPHRDDRRHHWQRDRRITSVCNIISGMCRYARTQAYSNTPAYMCIYMYIYIYIYVWTQRNYSTLAVWKRTNRLMAQSSTMKGDNGPNIREILSNGVAFIRIRST